MKFGKEFKSHLEETLPEWRDKFLCYKPLKKLLKHFPSSTTFDSQNLDPNFQLLQRHALPSGVSASASTSVDHVMDDYYQDNLESSANRPAVDLQEWFVRILNEELEKFNDFYVDKEEEFVIRLQELKERIQRLKGSRDGVFTSDSEFSEEMMEIRKDLVTIHGEMVLLKNYSSLNFAGLVKILKKYDKRTGGLLRIPFTQLALHQPFFTTEPLTRLVRECEAKLELLFPLEAEVLESNDTPDQSTRVANNTANVQAETSNLGQETMDIYRSTLAAMKAIRGLQKASSTCDPLSFSSLFRSQRDESTGTLTSENSSSNSPTMLHDAEDVQEDANSG